MGERLTSLDSAFLELETPSAHMCIGSLAIFEGDKFADEDGSVEDFYERLIRSIESRLHMAPRFRKKISTAPLNLAYPEWVDDPAFDIRYHVRRTALPSPGRDDQLMSHLSHIMSRPLDRAKPLWEIYIVEGLQGGRGALVQKTHHALIDGISAVDIGMLLLDPTPNHSDGEPELWEPEPASPLVQRILAAAVDRMIDPRKVVRTITSALSSPSDVATAIREGASGLASLTRSGVFAPPAPFNVPISPNRIFAPVRSSLADFKTIKDSLGGTVNDVVLASVSGGLRRYLLEHGEKLTRDSVLRAMVPVSVRDDSERMALGNRVSAFMVDLPIGIKDPVRRLRAVRTETKQMKESGQAVGANLLVELGGFAPQTLHALAARLGGSQRLFNLTVSNVPGPQMPLYILGSRLLEAFPVVPLHAGSAISVGVTSYDGGVFFGVNACREALPDAAIVAEGIEKSLAELLSAAC